MELNIATYEQFGAKGDGVTDDLDAIIACHNYANEHGIPVKATDGAKYYIGGKNRFATVKTDVDFGSAEFIIDDRALENIRVPVFKVAPDSEVFPVNIKSLKKSDRRVEFDHNGRVMVWVFNAEHNIFIREGLNMNSGVAQHEAFVVDGDGNIESTLNWDYEKITECYGISVEDKPITVRGGIFTTIANQAPSFYNYHARGFTVNRSNTTFTDMKHYVTAEGEHGAPYAGFINVNKAYNVTLKNLLVTPHFIYYTQSKIPGKDVPMGSYDINVGESVKVSLINIRQTIDIMDRRYWGVFTSNYSKEFYLDDCIISRFDAHQGATDVVIKNSTFGHQCIQLIGHGSFSIENSAVYGYAFITLRGDYGCHWDGSVSIKNCKWHPASTDSDIYVISAKNRGEHDFGFTAKMPETINIDGLEIFDKNANDACGVYILPTYSDGVEDGRPFPYVSTKAVTVNGINAASGREIKLAKAPELYPELS